MNGKGLPWHHEVITPSLEGTLRALREAKLVDSFYLAGGTGLALQFGHRLSQDLDFFTANLFDEDSLLQRVQKDPMPHMLAPFQWEEVKQLLRRDVPPLN